jgi:hypothetical protein
MRGDGPYYAPRRWKQSSAFGAALVALRLAAMLAARWRERPAAAVRPLERGPRHLCARSRRHRLGRRRGLERRRLPRLLPLRRLAHRCAARCRLAGGSWRAGGDPGPCSSMRGSRPVSRWPSRSTAPLAGTSIPEAQEYLALYPPAILAILGNGAGSIALDRGRGRRVPAATARERAPAGRIRRLRHAGKRGCRARRSANRRLRGGVAACLLYAGSVARSPDNSYLLQQRVC